MQRIHSIRNRLNTVLEQRHCSPESRIHSLKHRIAELKRTVYKKDTDTVKTTVKKSAIDKLNSYRRG